jgi:hypothetical protein
MPACLFRGLGQTQLDCCPFVLFTAPVHSHFLNGGCCLASLFWFQVWLQALQPDPSTGLLPAPTEVEFPAPIHWLRVSSACLLLLCEGGRVFVQLGPAGGGGEVVELR